MPRIARQGLQAAPGLHFMAGDNPPIALFQGATEGQALARVTKKLPRMFSHTTLREASSPARSAKLTDRCMRLTPPIPPHVPYHVRPRVPRQRVTYISPRRLSEEASKSACRDSAFSRRWVYEPTGH